MPVDYLQQNKGLPKLRALEQWGDSSPGTSAKRTRDRFVVDWRDGVGGIVVGGEQQVIDFYRVEAGEPEIEVRRSEFLQFEGEKLFVPRRPGRRPIHEQARGYHYGIAGRMPVSSDSAAA